MAGLLGCEVNGRHRPNGRDDMLRFSLALCCLFMASRPSLGQPAPIVVLHEFHIAEGGGFLAKTIKELGSREASTMLYAGCAVVGYNCQNEASAVRTWAQVASAAYTEAAGEMFISGRLTKHDGEAWNGIFDSPAGYDICKAGIVDPFAISGETTLNVRVIRSCDNGLGFYAVVPKNRADRGHHIDAYISILFVPAGTRSQFGCTPDDTPWLCRGPTCDIRKDL